MIDYSNYYRKDGTQDRELIEMIDKAYEQGRADAIEEVYNLIDEGVCDLCDCKDFDRGCYKYCQNEIRVLKEWLKNKLIK